MMNPFKNESDRILCVRLLKLMIGSKSLLLMTANHWHNNTALWSAELKYTYIGILLLEIYNRPQIDRQFFISVARITKI